MSPQSSDSPDESWPAEVCSVVEAVDRIGSKWHLVVLYDLQAGENRFNELKRSRGALTDPLAHPR